MAALVPPGVTCCEQVGTLGGILLSEEAQLLSPNTVSKRRAEFTAGRTCARTALAIFGIEPAPLLRGSRGEPLWPEHVTGSITHCSGYCAAAVTLLHRYRSFGIDAEPNEALPPHVLELIARPEEQQWIAKKTTDDVCWDRLLLASRKAYTRFGIRWSTAGWILIRRLWRSTWKQITSGPF